MRNFCRVMGWIVIAGVMLAAAARGAEVGGQAHEAVAGQLVDAGGKALAGVKVCMCTRNLDWFGTQLPQEAQEDDQLYVTTTDGAGRFSLAWRKANYALLVSTDAGYVIAKAKTLTFPLTLKLVPWARLEGVVTAEGKPAGAGLLINTYYTDEALQDEIGPYIHLWPQKTDAQGHFVFERTFAGECAISRRGQNGSGKSVRVMVEAGKTTQVTIPVLGRPLSGRITLPAEVAGHTWFGQASLTMAVKLPEIELPGDILKMTGSDREAWFGQWEQTLAGKELAAMVEQQREDSGATTMVGADGSFKFEEVPVGTRSLDVYIFDRVNGRTDYEHLLAWGSYPMVVPPGSMLGAPVELGVLAARPMGFLNRGQKAPDFVFPDMEGKEHLFSEFKGKVTLLEFWGVWCGVCLDETPRLKAIYAAYRDHPKFAMISLSVNDEAAKWREYVGKNEMVWTQGILGPREKAWPTKLYGVTGYPSMWVIGADGKVLGNGFKSETIRPVLAAALGAGK